MGADDIHGKLYAKVERAPYINYKNSTELVITFVMLNCVNSCVLLPFKCESHNSWYLGKWLHLAVGSSKKKKVVRINGSNPSVLVKRED